MFCRQHPDFYTPGSTNFPNHKGELTKSNEVLLIYQLLTFNEIAKDQSVNGSSDESPSTGTTTSDLTFGDDTFPQNKWVASRDRHLGDDSKPNKLFTYSHKRQKLRKTLDHLNDATVLALYGDNFETEPLLQARVRYFKPLNSKFE